MYSIFRQKDTQLTNSVLVTYMDRKIDKYIDENKKSLDRKKDRLTQKKVTKQIHNLKKYTLQLY